jgi:hypothetical protein
MVRTSCRNPCEQHWTGLVGSRRSAKLRRICFTGLGRDGRYRQSTGDDDGTANAQSLRFLWAITRTRPVSPILMSDHAHLPGLDLYDSSSHPGGNITGLPGYNAAQVILADLGITRPTGCRRRSPTGSPRSPDQAGAAVALPGGWPPRITLRRSDGVTTPLIAPASSLMIAIGTRAPRTRSTI